MKINTIKFFIVSLFLQTINAYTVFPAGSCKPQDCLSYSPYVLIPDTNVSDKICFLVSENKCNSSIDCCNSLQNVFEKIAVKTREECYSSIKQVTIDGIRKGGGVYITNYTGFAELKITALRWTKYTGLYKKICIELRSPCDTVSKFCNGNVCDYSVYDPFTHACCPTCKMNMSKEILLGKPPQNIEKFLPPPQAPPIIEKVDMYPPQVLESVLLPPQAPPVIEKVDMYPPQFVEAFPSPVLISSPPPIRLTPDENVEKIKLVIKVTTLDANMINDILCPKFSDYFMSSCKIFYTSSSGIYYGSYFQYDFDDLLDELQKNNDNFTFHNSLLCGSVITLSNDIRTLRYKASEKTCVKL